MLSAIIRKEFIEAWRDRRFLVISLLLGALLLLSIGVGAQRYSLASTQRAEAGAATYRQWLDQGDKNPHAAAHYGLYAFKGETPFAYADRGVNDFAGGSVWLEAHRQNLASARTAQDGLSVERIGAMTAGFLLQVILPLVIILLGHRTFAGERETGVLAQTLSVGAPTARLFAGKCLGAGAAIMALVAPVTLAGVVVLALAAAPGGHGWARAALFALLYGAYALLWMMVTVGVSAASRSARTALVVLVALWMTTCLVAPRVAAETARTLHPTPAYAAFAAAIERDTKGGLGGESQDQYRARMVGQALARYGVASPRDLPVNLQGLTFTWMESWGNAIFDHHFGRLWGLYDAQERVVQAAGLLSPAIAVRQLSMAIAGADLTTHRAFVSASEAKRRDFIAALNKDMTVNSRTGQSDYKAAAPLWSTIRPFTFTPPSPLHALARQGIAGAALLIWLVAAALAGALAVRRLKPGSL